VPWTKKKVRKKTGPLSPHVKKGKSREIEGRRRARSTEQKGRIHAGEIAPRSEVQGWREKGRRKKNFTKKNQGGNVEKDQNETLSRKPRG